MNESVKIILPSAIALIGTFMTIYFGWKQFRHNQYVAYLAKIEPVYKNIFTKVSGLNEKITSASFYLNKFIGLSKEIKTEISKNSPYLRKDDEKLLQNYLIEAEKLKELLSSSIYKETPEIASSKTQVSEIFDQIKEVFRKIIDGSLKISNLSKAPLSIGIILLLGGISFLLFLPNEQTVSILKPKNLETLNVEVDDGAAVVKVSGKSVGISESKSRIYVCTFVEKPYKSEEFWFQVVNLKADGSWETIVYPGSSKRPLTKEGKTILIQAFVATDEQINEEIKGHPSDNFVSDPSKFKVRSEAIRVNLLPK